MIHSMLILITLIIVGIANAAYLYWQGVERQRSGRPMICPIGGECEKVVLSRFGTTWGVKNEIWGLIFYFALLFLIAVSLGFPQFSYQATVVILFSSAVAVLFSTYLFFLQILVLRDYCSWCILATIINYVIFGAEVFFL